MLFYYYIYIVIAVLLIAVLLRYVVLGRKNSSVVLFLKARKNENAGDYAEAISNYEAALQEVNKIRFHKGLKSQIIDKLKILNSFIDYHQNLRMKRGAGEKDTLSIVRHIQSR